MGKREAQADARTKANVRSTSTAGCLQSVHLVMPTVFTSANALKSSTRHGRWLSLVRAYKATQHIVVMEELKSMHLRHTSQADTNVLLHSAPLASRYISRMVAFW